MYKDVGKRILAVMLCICMLVGMGSVSNFIARADGDVTVLVNKDGKYYTAPGVRYYDPAITADKASEFFAGVDLSYGNVTYCYDNTTEDNKDKQKYTVTKIENKKDGSGYTWNGGTGNVPKNVGEYTVTVTLGSDTKTFTYKILPCELTSNIVVNDAPYAGSPRIKYERPSISVVDDTVTKIISKLTLKDGDATLTGVWKHAADVNTNTTADYAYSIEVNGVEINTTTGGTNGDTVLNLVPYVGVKDAIKIKVIGRNNYYGFTGGNDNYYTIELSDSGKVSAKEFGTVTYKYWNGTTDSATAAGTFNIPWKNASVTPTVEVKDKNDTNMTLKEGEHYNVIYKQYPKVNGNETEKQVDVVDGKPVIKNPGKYSIEVRGIKAYEGRSTAPVVFYVKKSITDASNYAITYTKEHLYTGKSVEDSLYSSLVVTDKQTNENIKAYFSIRSDSNDNFINVGTSKVFYLVGDGYVYTDELQCLFTIKPVQVGVDDNKIRVEFAPCTFDPFSPGMTPEVTVSYRTEKGEYITIPSKDYNISYGKNTSAGAGTATITPKPGSPYLFSADGTGINRTFTIAPRPISGGDMSINFTSSIAYGATYPDVTIKVYNSDGSKSEDLIKGTDFTVSSVSTTNVGENTFTITGIGNYGGSVTETYTVQGMNLSNGSVTVLNPKNYVYRSTNEDIVPDVQVTVNGASVKKEYFDVVKDSGYKNEDWTTVGEKHFVVRGKNQYQGEIKGTFTILPKDITNQNNKNPDYISVVWKSGEGKYTYTGSAITPQKSAFDMYYNFGQMTENKVPEESYDISYDSNTNAGTAYVLITAKSGTNYTGTYKLPFTIDQVPFTKDTLAESGITVSATKKADGSSAVADVVASGLEFQCVAGMNPTTMKDVYGISVTRKLSDASTVTIPAEEYAYEYVPTYDSTRNHVIPGEGELRIKAADKNYTGTIVAKIKVRGSLNDATMDVPAELSYTGAAIDLDALLQTIPVKYHLKRNAEGSSVELINFPLNREVNGNGDYVVEAFQLKDKSNSGITEFKNVGDKATITITGKGCYEGSSITKTVTIVSYKVTTEDNNIDINVSSVEYDGTAIQASSLIDKIEMKHNGIEIVKRGEGSGKFTVAYADGESHTDAEENIMLKVTLTGIENYTGEKVIPFTITRKPIAKDDFTKADDVSVTVSHSGKFLLTTQTAIVFEKNPGGSVSADQPTVTVKWGASPNEKSVTFDITNNRFDEVGQAELIIEGTGNFKGTIKQPIHIYGDLKEGYGKKYQDANGSLQDVTKIYYNGTLVSNGTDIRPMYCGTEIQPRITVEYRGKSLYSSTAQPDYSRADSGDRLNVTLNSTITGGNQPKIVISGKNNYNKGDAENLEINYAIQPCVLYDAYYIDKTLVVTGLTGLDYDNGNEIRPAIKLELRNKNNNSAETYTVFDESMFTASNWDASDKKYKFNGFKVSYVNNIIGCSWNDGEKVPENAPKVIIEVDGKTNPNFDGTRVEIPFQIIGTNFNKYSTVEVIGNFSPKEFDGTDKTPAVEVYVTSDGKRMVVNSDNYDILPNPKTLNISATNAMDAVANDDMIAENAETTKGMVIVKGKNEFSGTVIKTFVIKPKRINKTDIDNGDYTVLVENPQFTGNALEPAVTIIDHNRRTPMTTESLYTQNYASGGRTGVRISDGDIGRIVSGETINAGGSGWIKVYGQNNYYTGNDATGGSYIVADLTKAIDRQFTIQPADFNKVSAASIDPQVYQGSQITLGMDQIKLSLGDEYQLKSSDYEIVGYGANVNAGTGAGTVKVRGKGNFTSTTRDLTFDITKRDINAPDAVTISPIPIQYMVNGSGEVKTPDVTIRCGSYTLVRGTDYDLAYGNNTGIGTATVTITAKGNFTGSTSTTFEIKSFDSELQLTNPPVYVTYTGQPMVPSLGIVKLGDTPLTKDRDYTVTYGNNTNAGEATATVTGIGTYAGKTLTHKFYIIAKSIANCEISRPASSMVFSGSPATPAVTVRDSGKDLVPGQDYNLTYLNNEKPGTASVIVSGVGNYRGSLKYDYELVVSSIGQVTSVVDGSRVTLSWSPATYVTGYEIYEGNVRIDRITGTSYTITGLKANTSYSYSVRGYTVLGGQIRYGDISQVTVTTK